MWLPKDERRLLRGYYDNIGEVGKQHEFFLEDLLGFIKSKETSHHTPSADDPQDTKGFQMWCEDWNRIKIANNALKERGLISSPNFESEPSQPVKISLTMTGCDLGRKYNSKCCTILLFCNEYKVWIILGLIISLFSVLVAILKN